MIKVTPYYKRLNCDEILIYYLNMVAEVVPFFPEDVLFGLPKMYDKIGQKPRKRTESYKQLLTQYGLFPENAKDKRFHDAKLAELLIKEYSQELHKNLYIKGNANKRNPPSINRVFLRKLLTAIMPHGNVPNKLKKLIPPKTNNNTKNNKAIDMLLKHVFRYDAFSTSKILKRNGKDDSPDIYQLVSMMEINVCPYCNRQLIPTVTSGKKRIRPQLDHFRSKSKYPFLALSINNLIPSCAICNLLKHDKDINLIYPYDEGLDDSYTFTAECDETNITALLTGAKNATQTFTIGIKKKKDNIHKKLHQRINNSIETLALNDLYQFHKDYVANLFSQQYILTKALLDDRRKQFHTLFQDDDAKYTLRLMKYSSEKWGQYPLAKLTHDISLQIDELYEDSEYIRILLDSTDND